jgi:hypothetical protein
MAKGFGRSGGGKDMFNAAQLAAISAIEAFWAGEGNCPDAFKFIFAQRGDWNWQRLLDFIANVNKSRVNSHLQPMTILTFPSNEEEVRRVIAWRERVPAG